MKNGNQNWMQQLHQHGTLKTFEKSEAVLIQGEMVQMIGLIITGQAIARVYTKQGQETLVGKFEEMDFFGHTSLLTDTPIGFEIIATTKLCVLLIPTQKFHDLLRADSAFSCAISQDLATGLNTMTNRLVEAVTLSSPGRVCAELMRLSNPVGIDPDKLIIRPNPVFVEFARQISSTRETVSRTISSLQKSGVLSREPGAILIHKPDALRSQIK